MIKRIEDEIDLIRQKTEDQIADLAPDDRAHYMHVGPKLVSGGSRNDILSSLFVFI